MSKDFFLLSSNPSHTGARLVTSAKPGGDRSTLGTTKQSQSAGILTDEIQTKNIAFLANALKVSQYF